MFQHLTTFFLVSSSFIVQIKGKTGVLELKFIAIWKRKSENLWTFVNEVQLGFVWRKLSSSLACGFSLLESLSQKGILDENFGGVVRRLGHRSPTYATPRKAATTYNEIFWHLTPATQSTNDPRKGTWDWFFPNCAKGRVKIANSCLANVSKENVLLKLFLMVWWFFFGFEDFKNVNLRNRKFSFLQLDPDEFRAATTLANPPPIHHVQLQIELKSQKTKQTTIYIRRVAMQRNF